MKTLYTVFTLHLDFLVSANNVFTFLRQQFAMKKGNHNEYSCFQIYLMFVNEWELCSEFLCL